MEMIEINNLVMYECPNCGYITKDKKGLRITCPKCTPDFKVWIGVSKKEIDEWIEKRVFMSKMNIIDYKI